MLGNGRWIVLGDADLAARAKAAVYGALCSGSLLCDERVLVERGVHDDFVDAVLAETDVMRLGDPFDARTTLVR